MHALRYRRRFSISAPSALGLVLLAGCAGAGGPGVEGPAARALFADFTGTWLLVPEESDSPQEALERAGIGRGQGRGGERPGFLPPRDGGGGRPGGAVGRPGGGDGR